MYRTVCHKHRRRKERALKKLADMDANLVRVLDLTNEIHRQLGPLAPEVALVAFPSPRVTDPLEAVDARLETTRGPRCIRLLVYVVPTADHFATTPPKRRSLFW